MAKPPPALILLELVLRPHLLYSFGTMTVLKATLVLLLATAAAASSGTFWYRPAGSAVPRFYQDTTHGVVPLMYQADFPAAPYFSAGHETVSLFSPDTLQFVAPKTYHNGPSDPTALVYYGSQQVAAPVTDIGRANPPLPCFAEGFYAHPINCSRFYRCVDYAATGQYFSRYEFECPQGQVFLTVGKDTCVPGDCLGAGPGASSSAGSYPQPGAGAGASSSAGSYPQPEAGAGASSSAGSYPQPGAGAGAVGTPPSGPVADASYPELIPVVETPGYPQPGAGAGASSSAGSYPQPGAGAGASSSAGSYPQPGAGASASAPAGNYPQPGTGSGAPSPSASYPQPGAGAGTAVPAVGYPQPGTGAGAHSPSAGYPQPGAGASAAAPAAGYPQPGTSAGVPSPSAGYPQPGAVVSAAAPSAGYPQPGSGAGAPAADYPQPDTAPALPGHLDCPARYVQDPLYCNIYQPCPTDGRRYVCTVGSVFDQARQMCRLPDKEDICGNKAIYVPAQFRFGSTSQALPVSTQQLPSYYSPYVFSTFQQQPLFSSSGYGQTFQSFVNQEQSFPTFQQVDTLPFFNHQQLNPFISEVNALPSFIVK